VIHGVRGRAPQMQASRLWVAYREGRPSSASMRSGTWCRVPPVPPELFESTSRDGTGDARGELGDLLSALRLADGIEAPQ
jgi:hypothetical protein